MSKPTERPATAPDPPVGPTHPLAQKLPTILGSPDSLKKKGQQWEK